MKPYERRIYFGFLALALSFIPAIFATSISLHKIIAEQRDSISARGMQLSAVERLRYVNSAQAATMPIYVLSGDPRVAESFERHYQEFDASLAHMLASETRPELRQKLLRIQDLSSRMRGLAEPGIRLRMGGASVGEVNAYFTEHTRPLAEELERQLHDLRMGEAAQLEQAKKHFSQTVEWVIGSLLFFLCLALLLMVFVGRLIVKTLRQKRAYDESQVILFRKAQQLSLARKEAVEVVAHDLKNPIGTVRMSVDMMLSDAGAEILEPREGLEIIRRSAESMERLIKDLLDHSKIEAGHLVLENAPCDLTRLAQDLLERFQPLAQQRDLALRADIVARACVVNCDLGRIEQVLSNLLGNALKFTPPKGQVKLGVSLQRDYALISVEDTGAGMDAGELEHVFDRFWQSKATAKQGNGLGLAIAKGIVEAHKGCIWAESVKGKGTKFFVTLPLMLGENRELDADPSAEPPGPSPSL